MDGRNGWKDLSKKMNTRSAIILAAGMGTRLRPITNTIPKCLIEVNGESILKRVLKSLSNRGIKEVVIVVGYLGQKIIDRFGDQYGGIKLTYIRNTVYDKTNSMYSVWLARKYLQKGTILIEGDVVFEESFIQMMLETNTNRSYWIVDKFKPEYDGCMLVANEQNRILNLKIVEYQVGQRYSNCYKSTGILKITPEYGKILSKWLTQEENQVNTNIYYDLVIAKHLSELPIYIQYIGTKKWIEIDTVKDLRRSEELFVREI